MHLVVHGLEFGEPDDLKRRLDQAATEKLNRLGAILAIADIGALDPDHFDDGLEDRSLEVGARGQADANDGAARADILGRLLERLLVDGDEDDDVGAKAVRGRFLDVGDEVRGGGKVDKGLGAELLRTHVLLVRARVDADDADAHGLCVLACERAEAAAGTNNGGELAGLDAGFFEAFVDGDAGAEDGGNGGEVAFLGDAGDVGGFGDAVLLEGAVDRVAGEEGLGAQRFVCLLAKVA